MDSEGKTKRETKEYLAAVDPQLAFEPTIRRKPVRAEETLEVRGAQKDSGSSMATGESVPSEASPSAESLRPEPEGTLEPARPEIYNFRFSADRAFREKLTRLGEVLGIPNPEKRMAEVFEQALDLALDKKDPKKKLKRRRKSEAVAARRETSPEKVSTEENPSSILPGR